MREFENSHPNIMRQLLKRQVACPFSPNIANPHEQALGRFGDSLLSHLGCHWRAPAGWEQAAFGRAAPQTGWHPSPTKALPATKIMFYQDKSQTFVDL
ncbi:MAG: hypothetical protein Q8R56_12155 [Polaromonas sp.]|nr:hypothetical protein [Polaromonas sp.]